MNNPITKFFEDRKAKKASATATGTKPVGMKDVSDFSLSGESGKWENEHFCSHCGAVCSHNEFMTKICDTCGTSGWKYQRVSRDILHSGEWKRQRRYHAKSFKARRFASKSIESHVDHEDGSWSEVVDCE